MRGPDRQPRKRRDWTAAEDEHLRRRYRDDDVETLCAALGRSRTSVRARLIKFGLPQKLKPKAVRINLTALDIAVRRWVSPA